MLTSQEISYTEEQRFVHTYAESSADGVGIARPRTETHGTSEEESEGWSASETFSEEESITESTTIGSNWAMTEGEEESIAETFTQGWNHSITDAEQEAMAFSESDSEAATESFGASTAHGAGRSHARMVTDATQVGWGMNEGQSWVGVELNPDAVHYSQNASVGGAHAHATSYGEGDTDFDMAGESYAESLSRIHAHGTTFSRGTSHAVTEGESESMAIGHTRGRSTSTREGGSVSQSHGETHGHGRAVQSGQQGSRSWGTSHSISEGVVPSRSHEEGQSHSVAITPFLAPHARRVISSIEYLSQEEQQLLALQEMQGLPPQQYTLAVNNRIVYVQAPYFPETEIATVTLQTQLARVYNRPLAIEAPAQPVLPAPVRAITAESMPLTAPMKDVTPAPLRLPEVLSDESSDTDEPDECYLFR